MKDTIKNTIHSIEPSETAKDRMYRNILQKASAQTETKTAKPRFSPARAARIALPLAACVCIVLLGVTRFLPGKVSEDTRFDDPPVFEGNPYVEADSAEDFLALGITLDAPLDAENKQYAVIGGELCEVEFDYAGHRYTLRAAKDGDPSGINGQKLSEEPVENGGNASLVTLQVEGKGECCLILWSESDVYYSLANIDGAAADEIKAVFEKIIL